ncbi:hypothetical protein PHLGIDRAFT_161643 [Phlebiopsis gigantea 11061_1 CR5-6]|uniref:Uncharacterized protein n=1 Tax=Phlebiopsis gigantea (strain 11061_1 CR5-6) TaxID=745531 RepID=A0A0C3RVJ9_PHLG1|nr:hypothetical protein PHLGIDRAFT_161643 [Phlebiopsis gigantea 11061_1 CR5-6]
MADPPPKKVGSLRDRIAAFENKSTSSTPTSPPAPRPKPAGHVSWKPRPASPSPADEPAQSEKKPSAGVGMSAADAKAAIGAGGSLKERMAALQGHGGFGGAAPPAAPPKPAGEKPKWKPPPQVASPPPDESQPRTSTEDHVVSEENEPKTGHEAEEAGEERPKDEADEKSGEARELDPEEAERQRRAALAARMARLGGARVGMGPPIFGQKPDVPKKPSAPKAEEPKVEAPEKDTPLSPPIDKLHDTQTSPTVPADVRSPAASSEQEYFAQENKSSTSLLSADSTPTSQPRSPAMPVPAAPRRAAPPRRKAPKSPTPPGAVIADAPVTESPAADTPQLTSDDSSKELQEAVHKSKEDEVSLGLSPVTQPLQSAHDPPHAEPAEHAEEFANPAEVEEHAEETSPEETRVVQDSLDQLALDNESEHVQAELPDAHSTHEEPIVEERSPDFEPQQPSAEPEEEEDEAERRMRIAERLKQQGGFNPFGASPSPPVRTSSEQEPPSRKASVDVHREETAPEPEQVVSEPEIVTNVMRRQSTDYNARSLDSPKSPPLPPASTRPDGRTKRDSDMSNLSVHKVGEAEDNDESVDDSSNIPIYNDHPLDEHDEEARVADIHSESEDYVDAPEEQDQTPKFAHEESVPALTDTELELQAVVSPRKRVSLPPPSRSVPARPPVVQDEYVYDEFDEVPPTPPRRTSIPPPPRAAPPPAVEHVEEVNEGFEQIHPPPPKQTSILPPPRAMPPSPPEVQEAEQPEQPPPSPPRRASVPPPHANAILPPHPVTYNEDEEDEDLSRVPKSVSTASYEDPQDGEDAPPPPPRRISIPPPSRYAPPSSPPSHAEAQDHEHEHGSLPPSPVHPRRSIPRRRSPKQRKQPSAVSASQSVCASKGASIRSVRRPRHRSVRQRGHLMTRCPCLIDGTAQTCRARRPLLYGDLRGLQSLSGGRVWRIRSCPLRLFSWDS